MIKRPITLLRIVGLAEGASFLILLLVAMPLKYFADLPIFVRIFGSIHGGLFLLYVAAAIYAFRAHRWSWWKFAKVFVASLIPAGTFFIDHGLREEARATEPETGGSSAAAEEHAKGLSSENGVNADAIYIDYVDTLEVCSKDYSTLDDEDAAWDYLFEDIDINFGTFFYIDNLRALEAAGYIDAADVEEGASLRARWLELMGDDRTRSLDAMRTSEEWHAFFARCRELRTHLS